VLRLRTLLCLSLLAAAASLAPAAAQPRPAFVAQIETALNDDPRAALTLAQAQLRADAAPADRFWALLGQARTWNALEQREQARRAAERAAAELAAWPEATALAQGTLALVQREVSWMGEESVVARRRFDAAAGAIAQADDATLACHARNHDRSLLTDIGSFDEAWITAEALELCARELGLVEIESTALYVMGHIAARGRGRTQTEADIYFERALRVLGERPARWARSVVLWERGIAQHEARQPDAALRHLAQARALSQAIDDRAGIAAAAIAMAEVFNEMKQPHAALPLLNEARSLLDEQQDGGFRLPAVAEQRVIALAMLRRPEVLAEIERARRWDTPDQPASARMKMARAMAAGYASQGRFEQAYAEAERAQRLSSDSRQFAADIQTQRLQARYAAAQRDAENAALRHRAETDRLALAADNATQRALWAALAALLLVAGALSVVVWRTWQHRRALADLALRDELTGQPNRRAVRAYAQVQLEQSQRLHVPLTLAMIDLDHFKRVNDTQGHAAGDAVLRALAQSAAAVLRGQDRLGRWGGEEWLLVMPGTSAREVPAVFARLRERFLATHADGMSGAHGCTFSMGAAQLSNDTPTLDALVAECDRQLYRAKLDGRDRLQVAAPEARSTNHTAPASAINSEPPFISPTR
jgi:diguanylate cyclase (GGDEF)-like protein